RGLGVRGARQNPTEPREVAQAAAGQTETWPQSRAETRLLENGVVQRHRRVGREEQAPPPSTAGLHRPTATAESPAVAGQEAGSGREVGRRPRPRRRAWRRRVATVEVRRC